MVRNLECFASRPILRIQVHYEKDRKHCTQIEWAFANQLKAQQSGISIKDIKVNLGPRTRAMTLCTVTVEQEKGQFTASYIGCKNDHTVKKGVTSVMFVFSCEHHVILGIYYYNNFITAIM